MWDNYWDDYRHFTTEMTMVTRHLQWLITYKRLLGTPN